ncbi:PilZ domain-containing protein [Hydrogenispora ethanolica]|uniref:PilZ domain-containing protein n=1 Tax=Hydrogenispora ethanolica TaxID=1082276 RepID=A0A4R1R9H5_HYDET|nr:PilZ domain-containing protein [Hydrogenispora ethanolica]TCL62022.1 PilZ domain-containing protein [Hydrogenispora ethanolica]
MLRGIVNRRKTSRVPFQNEMNILLEVNGQTQALATATNVSSGGIQFYVLQGFLELKIGELIELVFYLPGLGMTTVRGEICYLLNSTDNEERPVLYYGVKFRDITPEVLKGLEIFCLGPIREQEREPSPLAAAAAAAAASEVRAQPEPLPAPQPGSEAEPFLPENSDPKKMLTQEAIDRLVAYLLAHAGPREERTAPRQPELAPPLEKSRQPSASDDSPASDDTAGPATVLPPVSAAERTKAALPPLDFDPVTLTNLLGAELLSLFQNAPEPPPEPQNPPAEQREEPPLQMPAPEETVPDPETIPAGPPAGFPEPPAPLADAPSGPARLPATAEDDSGGFASPYQELVDQLVQSLTQPKPSRNSAAQGAAPAQAAAARATADPVPRTGSRETAVPAVAPPVPPPVAPAAPGGNPEQNSIDYLVKLLLQKNSAGAAANRPAAPAPAAPQEPAQSVPPVQAASSKPDSAVLPAPVFGAAAPEHDSVGNPLLYQYLMADPAPKPVPAAPEPNPGALQGSHIQFREGNSVPVSIEDLSIGGVTVRLAEPISEQANVLINLAAEGTAIYNIVAVCDWSGRYRSGDYLAGFNFCQLTPEQTNQLRTMIQRLHM